MPPRRLNRSASPLPPSPPRRKRKTLKPSQRFELLQAANFTCQTCGRKPPEVQLEIDHIVPFSKGGACNLNNFQVLCRDCNRGKGARLLNKPTRKKVIKGKANPKISKLGLNKTKKRRPKKFDLIKTSEQILIKIAPALNKIGQVLLRQPLIKGLWVRLVTLIRWVQPYLDLEGEYD